MRQFIRKQDWKGFFDRISGDFLEWETSVRILSDGSNPQVLTDGSPFNGITYDDDQGHDQMDVTVGAFVSANQMFSIDHPQCVSFEPAQRGTGGTLSIEDSMGTKTRIEFRRPKPMSVEYIRSEVLMAG
jgi:hypothetical protein